MLLPTPSNRVGSVTDYNAPTFTPKNRRVRSLMSRHCSCYKARNFPPALSSNSAWVSDELLRSAFNRFSGYVYSNSRHGSFAPGPLECRRRLGRRRLAQLTQSGNTAAYDIGILWGPPSEMIEGQWQWQAPTKHEPSAPKSSGLLLRWLLQWKSTPEQALRNTGEFSLNPVPVRTKDHVESFRTLIQGSRQNNIAQTCDNFITLFRQDLGLGMVTNQNLYSALQSVTEDLRKTFTCTKSANQQCLLFYQAIWDGIMTCKVFRHTEYEGTTMDRFLCLLTQLHMGSEVLNLACSVLRSISAAQAQSMSAGIQGVIRACVNTWQAASGWRYGNVEIANLERLVDKVQIKLIVVQAMVSAASRTTASGKLALKIRQALFNINLAITSGMGSAAIVNENICPFTAAADALATALENIPDVYLRQNFAACSAQFAAECSNWGEESWKIRYIWMSLVVRVSCMNQQDVLQNWRNIELQRTPLKETECSEILLSHWIAQGIIKHPEQVRNGFEVCGTPNRSFASLLVAINKYEGAAFARAQDALYFLRQIGQNEWAFTLLPRLFRCSVKFHRFFFEQVLEAACLHDVYFAIGLWDRCKHYLCRHQPLRLDYCPTFAQALINDARISQSAIWQTFGFPHYRSLHRRRGVHKEISLSMVTAVSKMATAFARSDARPARASLHNVSRCLHHLCAHGVKITPELTRAITQVGLIRAVVTRRGVGRERLRWILGLIARTEGTETAEAVDNTIYWWQRNLIQERMASRRENNVLRLGPID